jgi:hypothetical protein
MYVRKRQILFQKFYLIFNVIFFPNVVCSGEFSFFLSFYLYFKT